MTISLNHCTGVGVFVLAVFCCVAANQATQLAQGMLQVPRYAVDPSWPKPLPKNWIVGAVVGVAVDARDHIWITHRPGTLQPNETRSGWQAAPPVLEFDQTGMSFRHGVDPDRDTSGRSSNTASMWTTKTTSGSAPAGDKDAHILKFTREGRS